MRARDRPTYLADLTAALLHAHGLEVWIAYSAHDALTWLENDPAIDAIFSDVMMPGMSGIQLADIVRNN